MHHQSSINLTLSPLMLHHRQIIPSTPSASLACSPKNAFPVRPSFISARLVWSPTPSDPCEDLCSCSYSKQTTDLYDLPEPRKAHVSTLLSNCTNGPLRVAWCHPLFLTTCMLRKVVWFQDSSRTCWSLITHRGSPVQATRFYCT